MARDMNREWEVRRIVGHTHRTVSDARLQVARAKVGAHVAATDDYLLALKYALLSWVDEIDSELASRIKADINESSND